MFHSHTHTNTRIYKGRSEAVEWAEGLVTAINSNRCRNPSLTEGLGVYVARREKGLVRIMGG